MLPKTYRIQKDKEIERIFKKGKGFREDFLIIKTIDNDLGKTRFCFSVSKKVSKKANIRNTIKRKLNEIVRNNIKTLKEGKDNLIIVLPGAEGKNFSELKETITKLFIKARLTNYKK